MTFKAPVFRYTDVGNIAENFLETYHPDFSIPVPIEHIIEMELNLHIVGIQYMWTRLKKSGWMSADRTVIFVDQYQQDNYWEKYRFTLAHEVGHYVMHEDAYAMPDFETIEEQIAYLYSRDPHEIDWFEKQGNWFAGHILVPTRVLESLCTDLVTPYLEKHKGDHLPSEGFKLYAASRLASVFQVNQIVVEIRIDKEGLVDKLLKEAD